MIVDQMSLVLAIINELSEQNEDYSATPRHLSSIIDAANLVVAEFKQDKISSAPHIGIEAWRKTDDVGASSDFMAARLGNAGIREAAHPEDPKDFHRCCLLLEAAPELRDKLHFMASEGPEWTALVENWDELEGLLKKESTTGSCPLLYSRMKELLKVL